MAEKTVREATFCDVRQSQIDLSIARLIDVRTQIERDSVG